MSTASGVLSAVLVREIQPAVHPELERDLAEDVARRARRPELGSVVPASTAVDVPHDLLAPGDRVLRNPTPAESAPPVVSVPMTGVSSGKFECAAAPAWTKNAARSRTRGPPSATLISKESKPRRGFRFRPSPGVRPPDSTPTGEPSNRLDPDLVTAFTSPAAKVPKRTSNGAARTCTSLIASTASVLNPSPDPVCSVLASRSPPLAPSIWTAVSRSFWPAIEPRPSPGARAGPR